MKHTWKITAILLSMFLITQLIGLAVIHAYTPQYKTILVDGEEQKITLNPLPFGMQPPELKEPIEFWYMLPMILIAFIIAIALFFLLSRIKITSLLRVWFFVVVILAVGITLNALFLKLGILSLEINLSLWKFPLAWLIAALVALPLAFYKIFRQHLLIHNVTELMIYPGIAAVFVPILNIWTIIILLLLISAYDIYAVWHSGFMQKMAKFQMDKLKFFAGFFVPYLGKKQRKEIKLIKQKYKNKKNAEKALKKKKIKISLAILGGGDVIFPIIAAGIFLRAFGLLPALIVTFFATLALAFLFVLAKKGKFYPAMPFLSAGIFIGMIIARLLV